MDQFHIIDSDIYSYHANLEKLSVAVLSVDIYQNPINRKLYQCVNKYETSGNLYMVYNNSAHKICRTHRQTDKQQIYDKYTPERHKSKN